MPSVGNTVNFLHIRTPKTRWHFIGVMHPKDAEGIANSVDPDHTAPRSILIWVCTVCQVLSVRKLRTYENYGMQRVCMAEHKLRSCYVQQLQTKGLMCVCGGGGVGQQNQCVMLSCS